MLDKVTMLRYVDVSHDRTALARSGLRDTLLAETAALGFNHAGWIATVIDTAGGASSPTYLAIRKRYREVADPRMQRQQLIAVVIGVLALLGMATTQVVPIGASVLLAFFACLLPLFFVAPVLARGAKAPPPREARELLRLADDVRQGFLAS